MKTHKMVKECVITPAFTDSGNIVYHRFACRSDAKRAIALRKFYHRGDTWHWLPTGEIWTEREFMQKLAAK
jgi:hypothetical protein